MHRKITEADLTDEQVMKLRRLAILYEVVKACPRRLLKLASEPTSILHNLFDWSDTTDRGWRNRMMQAHRIVRLGLVAALNRGLEPDITLFHLEREPSDADRQKALADPDGREADWCHAYDERAGRMLDHEGVIEQAVETDISVPAGLVAFFRIVVPSIAARLPSKPGHLNAWSDSTSDPSEHDATTIGLRADKEALEYYARCDCDSCNMVLLTLAADAFVSSSPNPNLGRNFVRLLARKSGARPQKHSDMPRYAFAEKGVRYGSPEDLASLEAIPTVEINREASRIDIYGGNSNYEKDEPYAIDFDRVKTVDEVADWMAHIPGTKGWARREVFLHALRGALVEVYKHNRG